GLPGVWVEDKEICFAVHYRQASLESIKEARKVMHVIPKLDLKLIPGKKVWEVVPKDFPAKGAAVKRLLTKLPPRTLAIYAGDDQADEPAFAAVPNGLTVRVGCSHVTHARYYLRSPREMWDFLDRVEQETA